MIDADRARLLRATAQGIAGGHRAASAPEALERAFAVQAQDATAAALGFRARTRGLTAAELTRAYEQDRSIVRGWFMRGTLYTVPAADLRWLTDLLGPVFLKLSARRYRELGLGPAELAAAEQLITAALSQGPLTRAELTERLATLGLDTTGQVPIHLLRRCALLGLICHGPVRDGEVTFALLDDWLPAATRTRTLTQPEAAHELARRYLAAHGPAALPDFTTWSGLPTTLARPAWQALAETNETCEVAGRPCLLPGDPADAEPTRDVRLLPAYDNYLVGYRTRALSVPTAHERQVWPGGGQLRPTVMVDGLACATWGRRGATVDLTPFAELPAEVRDAVESEKADISRFLTGS